MRLVYKSAGTQNNQMMENAISLLDLAIKIDSSYFTAYKNKFTFQTQLKQYANAKLTAKQMVTLRPNDADYKKIMAGGAFERAGDLSPATQYYKSALVTYNRVLDTMSVTDKGYRSLEIGKAMNLILLNKEKEGRDLLKGLLAKETDPAYKLLFEEYMNFNKHDILYGKEHITAENANPVKR